MMRMIEDGHFALDDPVAEYFPEINGLSDKPEGSSPVTFRHLASHMSGLDREPELDGAADGPIELWEEQVLASIPETHFLAAPGARYSYSNIGYGILGLAISRAVDRPFMDLTHETVFDPLGMIDSFYVLTPEHAPRLATGYARAEDGSIDPEPPADQLHVSVCRGHRTTRTFPGQDRSSLQLLSAGDRQQRFLARETVHETDNDR